MSRISPPKTNYVRAITMLHNTRYVFLYFTTFASTSTPKNNFKLLGKFMMVIYTCTVDGYMPNLDFQSSIDI